MKFFESLKKIFYRDNTHIESQSMATPPPLHPIPSSPDVAPNPSQDREFYYINNKELAYLEGLYKSFDSDSRFYLCGEQMPMDLKRLCGKFIVTDANDFSIAQAVCVYRKPYSPLIKLSISDENFDLLPIFYQFSEAKPTGVTTCSIYANLQTRNGLVPLLVNIRARATAISDRGNDYRITFRIDARIIEAANSAILRSYCGVFYSNGSIKDLTELTRFFNYRRVDNLCKLANGECPDEDAAMIMAGELPVSKLVEVATTRVAHDVDRQEWLEYAHRHCKLRMALLFPDKSATESNLSRIHHFEAKHFFKRGLYNVASGCFDLAGNKESEEANKALSLSLGRSVHGLTPQWDNIPITRFGCVLASKLHLVPSDLNDMLTMPVDFLDDTVRISKQADIWGFTPGKDTASTTITFVGYGSDQILSIYTNSDGIVSISLLAATPLMAKVNVPEKNSHILFNFDSAISRVDFEAKRNEISRRYIDGDDISLFDRILLGRTLSAHLEYYRGYVFEDDYSGESLYHHEKARRILQKAMLEGSADEYDDELLTMLDERISSVCIDMDSDLDAYANASPLMIEEHWRSRNAFLLALGFANPTKSLALIKQELINCQYIMDEADGDEEAEDFCKLHYSFLDRLYCQCLKSAGKYDDVRCRCLTMLHNNNSRDHSFARNMLYELSDVAYY